MTKGPTRGQAGQFIKSLEVPPDQLPWSEELLAFWRQTIQRAEQLRQDVEQKYDWAGNLTRYSPQPKRDDINGMQDFRDVERKKAALFFKTPQIALAPRPGSDPQLLSAIALRQVVLNAMLAPRECGGVGALRTVQQALFDVLCPSGVGPCMVGYTAVTVPVERAVPVVGPDGQPIPVMDPLTGQPAMGPDGQIQFQTQQQNVPVPIHQAIFFEHLSPQALLLPAELKTTDTDSGAWIGYRWRRPTVQVRQAYQKPEDWEPGQGGKAPHFDPTDTGLPGLGDTSPEPMTDGCTIYYRPALMPLAEAITSNHPDAMAVLTLAASEDVPLEHRFLPWQTLTPEGALTPDSLRGFPIDPLIVRDLSDAAYVPSDCAVTAALTVEENRGRTIDQQRRRANRLIMLYDPEELPTDKRDAVKDGSIGTFVDVRPGALKEPSGVAGIMAQAGQLNPNRADYEWLERVESDREKALGIGANQVGTETDTARTATESSYVQRNTEARFEQERDRVTAWFLRCVKKIDVLLQRYGAALVPQLVGPQIAQGWAQTAAALGHYTYEIQMDSGRFVDIESHRRQKLQLLNMVGQSPNVNTVPLIRDIVKDFGYDPQTVVIEQPEPPKPEPPKLSLSIKTEHLDPMLGAIYANVYAILTQQGVQGLAKPMPVDPMTGMVQAQPPQPTGAPPQIPETLPKMPTLNQHQMDESGQRTGPKVM